MTRKTKRKSKPQPSPLAAVLEQFVLPVIRAEEQPGCDGGSIDLPGPESDDHPCVRGFLRGGWMLHCRPLPVDDTRTLLRLSMLCPATIKNSLSDN